MTPIDNAMRSKNMLLGKPVNEWAAAMIMLVCIGFSALVTGVAVWAIWGSDVFPEQPDPKGDPDHWTREELRRWLALRNLHPQSSDTTEQLRERVKVNMRIPRP